jgi:hypothetical protein
MAEDLFGTQTSITDPTERKILADVMQQFNISRQIGGRQKERYGLAALEDNTNTFEIERARQLTDLLNRSRMSQAERDRLAAQEAARLQAQKDAYAAANAGRGAATGGLTQEQLQKYIDAMNRSGAQPPRGQTWASLLTAVPALITTLFGGSEGNQLRQQGVLGYGMDKLSGLFGLGKGSNGNPFGMLQGTGDPRLADDPFNLQGLLGEGNKLPQLMNVPPPLSFEEWDAGNPDDWGFDGVPIGWEPPDPDPLPPLYGFDE